MYFRSFRARSATEVNTPRDNVALDLSKPQFHLIEPGRIRGREMEADSGMLLQKLLHRFGFVGGEIVQHDVNLSCPARFPQQPRRNTRNSALVSRFAVWPSTLP